MNYKSIVANEILIQKLKATMYDPFIILKTLTREELKLALDPLIYFLKIDLILYRTLKNKSRGQHHLKERKLFTQNS